MFEKVKQSKIVEIVATVSFIVFMITSSLHSLLTPISTDPYNLHEGKLIIINEDIITHAYPPLAPVLFKAIPEYWFFYLSGLSYPLILLSIYFFYSKKIIYYFPLFIPLVLYFPSFSTPTIDWITIPFVYYFLKNEKNIIAGGLSVFLIYMHGFHPLLPLVVVYRKNLKELYFIILIGIPLFISLIHFSSGYYGYWSKQIFVYTFYGYLTTYVNLFWLRVSLIIIYTFTLFLMREG